MSGQIEIPTLPCGRCRKIGDVMIHKLSGPTYMICLECGAKTETFTGTNSNVAAYVAWQRGQVTGSVSR